MLSPKNKKVRTREIPATLISGGSVHGNQFLCPCKPLRGQAKRMRSAQLERLDPKQSRAKNRPQEVWVSSSRISCPKSRPCLIRPPSSNIGVLGDCVVLALPEQPHKASGFGGSSLWPLNLPSLPTAVPVTWKKAASSLAIFDAETACIAHSFLRL